MDGAAASMAADTSSPRADAWPADSPLWPPRTPARSPGYKAAAALHDAAVAARLVAQVDAYARQAAQRAEAERQSRLAAAMQDDAWLACGRQLPAAWRPCAQTDTLRRQVVDLPATSSPAPGAASPSPYAKPPVLLAHPTSPTPPAPPRTVYRDVLPADCQGTYLVDVGPGECTCGAGGTWRMEPTHRGAITAGLPRPPPEVCVAVTASRRAVLAITVDPVTDRPDVVQRLEVEVVEAAPASPEGGQAGDDTAASSSASEASTPSSSATMRVTVTCSYAAATPPDVWFPDEPLHPPPIQHFPDDSLPGGTLDFPDPFRWASSAVHPYAPPTPARPPPSPAWSPLRTALGDLPPAASPRLAAAPTCLPPGPGPERGGHRRLPGTPPPTSAVGPPCPTAGPWFPAVSRPPLGPLSSPVSLHPRPPGPASSAPPFPPDTQSRVYATGASPGPPRRRSPTPDQTHRRPAPFNEVHWGSTREDWSTAQRAFFAALEASDPANQAHGWHAAGMARGSQDRHPPDPGPGRVPPPVPEGSPEAQRRWLL